MISADPLKIVLLHLYSNGDCLFATVVARQIKNDFPNCYLTWYVGVQAKGMLLHNPNIDALVEIDARGEKGIQVWHDTHHDLEEKVKAGVFDRLFSTQIIGDNEKNYCGTIRGTVFRNYPYPISVGYTPDLFISDAEVQRVAEVTAAWDLSRYKKVVLFECAPVSRQVALDPVIATRLSELALAQLNDTCIILTSAQKIQTSNPNIFDASVFSVRENAALLNHCTHLIGCSSGISWMAASSACKKIPMLQFLSNRAFYFNSMRRDYAYLKLDASHILETEFGSEQEVVNRICAFLEDYSTAFKLYNVEFPDRSTTVYSLSRTRILNGHTSHALRILKGCFRLNRTNPFYYLKIVKLILLYPFYQVLRFRKEVLKEDII